MSKFYYVEMLGNYRFYGNVNRFFAYGGMLEVTDDYAIYKEDGSSYFDTYDTLDDFIEVTKEYEPQIMELK